MEFIDKKHHASAHALVLGFLQKNKNLHNGQYTDDLYNNLCADWCAPRVKTKKALTAILMQEQNNRCCYCMRDIAVLPPEERSIEHVIVNNPINGNDYNQYLGHGSTLDQADIINASDFLQTQTPPPPYPHSVAYENMLMSCAGRVHAGIRTSFTCNGKRAHTFLPPMPLMPTIHSEIKYRRDGFVYWTKDSRTESPFVEVVGLNEMVLQIIRRLWYKLASRNEDSTTCDRQSIIYEVLGDMLDEGKDDAALQLLFVFAKNSWYWHLLSQFNYFNDVNKFI